ncbi:hypothetical protein, partial [Natrialba sp. PRR66]
AGGVVGMIVAKGVALAAVAAIVVWAGDRIVRLYALGVGTVLHAIAVANNLAWLLVIGGGVV